MTRNGTVLMNMLERLLESTEIDARDVETEQTLLEQLGKKTKLLGVGTVDAGEKRFDASEIQRLPVDIDNIISHY